MKFVHIHSSGRYDRSPKSLHNAFLSYTSQAGIVTLTEVEFEAREQALHAPHWEKVTGDKSNRDDSAVCWDGQKYELVYSEQFKIKGGSYLKSARGKATDPLYGSIVILEDGLGSSIIIGVIHTPSGVEGDLAHSRKKTSRALAWLHAVRGMGRRMNKLARKFKTDGSMLVADWNINFKKRWAQVLIKTMFPSWTLTWRKYPSGGTHGNRVIDGTLIKGRLKVIKAPELIKDDDSSDHRPYKETLGI